MNADGLDHSDKISIWLEIILLLMMVTGVYFIISDFDLAIMFRDAILFLDEKISMVELSGIAAYSATISHIEWSNIFGIGIIVWSSILVFLRFRRRLVAAFILPDECPECGSLLTKKGRTALQQIITSGLMLSSQSLYCSECDENNVIFRYKVKGKT